MRYAGPSIIKHVIHKVVEGDLDMNARRKKWFPILVASLLLAGSLAGCSGSEPKPEAAQRPAESKTENVYKDKYDPEVTITTVWGVDPTRNSRMGKRSRTTWLRSGPRRSSASTSNRCGPLRIPTALLQPSASGYVLRTGDAGYRHARYRKSADWPRI